MAGPLLDIHVNMVGIDSVGVPHLRLPLCRVTVAVSATFAGKFRSGEVSDLLPPVLSLLSSFPRDA